MKKAFKEVGVFKPLKVETVERLYQLDDEIFFKYAKLVDKGGDKMNYSLKKHIDTEILNNYEDILDLKSLQQIRELNEDEKRDLLIKETKLQTYKEIKSICDCRKRY